MVEFWHLAHASSVHKYTMCDWPSTFDTHAIAIMAMRTGFISEVVEEL
jgi:hypothetical protein